MKVWRLRKLPFGVNCSPYILTVVLRHHITEELEQAHPDVQGRLSLLRDSLYVDDCLSSLETLCEAEDFRQTCVTCLSSANIELRKWRGNTLGREENSSEKALGVRWNAKAYLLQVEV